jgi:hypothetical protein
MKRMIWAMIGIVAIISGCQRQSCSEIETHLIGVVRDHECQLLIETIYLEQSVFPESVEMAEFSVKNLGNYAKRIQMSPFLNKDRQRLNDVKLEIVNDTKALYQLFLNTPTDEWYTSEKIKMAKTNIFKKKTRFIEENLKICT